MRLRAGEARGEGEDLPGSAPPGRPEAPTSLRFPQCPTPRSLPLICSRVCLRGLCLQNGISRVSMKQRLTF